MDPSKQLEAMLGIVKALEKRTGELDARLNPLEQSYALKDNAGAGTVAGFARGESPGALFVKAFDDTARKSGGKLRTEVASAAFLKNTVTNPVGGRLTAPDYIGVAP